VAATRRRKVDNDSESFTNHCGDRPLKNALGATAVADFG